MYARSTTVQGDPQLVDEAIAYVGEKEFPAVTALQGCVGLSMLADRSTGRVVVSSAWADEESLNASREKVRPMQDRLALMLHAEDALIQPWDVAVIHRERPSGDDARAQVASAKVAPEHVDALLDAYKKDLLPRLRELDGFCSMSLVVNREQGRAVRVTSFASADALDQARAQLERIGFAQARTYDVADMDVVVAHLHVPDNA